MISKPINSVLKSKFKELHKAASAKANDDYKLFQDKLNSLDNHFDKFKMLYEEDERLEKLTDENPHPYYVENHSTEEWLLNQFAGRSVILNIDEAAEFEEAIYLGAYNQNITKQYWELKKEIPKYTYTDFLQGKICRYLNTFEKAYNIEEDDYYKIRQWQADKLVMIVEYEYRFLIRKVQQHCKSLSDPLKFILEEKEKIEAIDKLPADATIIKEHLSKLYIYAGCDVYILDNDLLKTNFKIYKDERLTWQGVYPLLIKPLVEKVAANYKKPFLSETTLFFVINKIADWYELVLNGQSVQQEIVSPDWDKLLQQLFEEVKTITKEAIEPIEDYAYNEELNKDDVKNYLIDKFEDYRHKFNSCDKKYFFGIVDEEKRETLRRMFITNSFFGNDVQGQYDAIKEAMVIHDVSWEIAGIYGHIFDTHKMDYPERNGSHIEIMSLLNQMVIDKELYTEQRKIMDDFMEHFHAYRLPIEMHFQNHREAMSELFRKALNRLEGHLDDAEPTNKILYLQSRLKELRQRELYYKQIKHELVDDDDALRYSTLFKEFLEIEAHFVKETKDIDNMLSLPNSEKPKLLANGSSSSNGLNVIEKSPTVIPPSFKYLDFNTNYSNLTDLLKYLQLHNFVSKETSLTSFRKVFSGTIVEQPVIWKGSPSELYYFITCLIKRKEKIDDCKQRQWFTTVRCFVQEDGAMFDRNKLRLLKKPATAGMIEKAVSIL